MKQLLENTHGDKYTFVIKTTSTLGDEVLDVPLSVIGNKNPGLFTKELEHGLIRGSYDLAVHSLKDMPTTLPETLSLTGILKREDPTDCLVLHKAYTKEQFVNNNDTLIIWYNELATVHLLIIKYPTTSHFDVLIVI